MMHGNPNIKSQDINRKEGARSALFQLGDNFYAVCSSLIVVGHSGFESQKAFQPKLLIVLFYVLFMCNCVLILLPPGVNPTAFNKYINIISEAFALLRCCAVYDGSCVPTFWDNLSVPSSKVK